MVTLVKIYSTEYFYNTKVAGLGEILSSENFVVYGIMIEEGAKSVVTKEEFPPLPIYTQPEPCQYCATSLTKLE